MPQIAKFQINEYMLVILLNTQIVLKSEPVKNSKVHWLRIQSKFAKFLWWWPYLSGEVYKSHIHISICYPW